MTDHVKSIRIEQSIEEVEALIAKSEHGPLMGRICRYLILRPESKTNCVLFHGAPGSGKAQFIGRLKEIFTECVDCRSTRGHFDQRYKQR